jgi:predicted PurR-regulated permease PerM
VAAHRGSFEETTVTEPDLQSDEMRGASPRETPTQEVLPGKDDSARVWRFQRFFLLVALLGVGVLFIYTIHIFLLPILLATVFATLFHPLYGWILRRLGGRRVLASLLTCLLLVLGFLGPLYSVGHLVWLEASDLRDNVGQWLEEIQDRQQAGGEGWVEMVTGTVTGWVEKIPLVNQLDLGDIDWNGLIQTVAREGGQLLTTVAERTGRGAFQVVLLTFVTLFTLFYFLMDGPRLTQRARDLIPLDPASKQAIADRFVSVSRALFKGTLLIAVIQGILGGLTLWIFGVRGAVLWGVLVGILSIIPAIGPWLVLYPAAAILLFTGQPWRALGVFLVTVVVILQIDNLLRPRLVGSGARMHDLLIFFSTLGGIAAFGPMGFIVGPVVAALFLALLEIYSEEFAGELGGETKGLEEG